MVKFQKLVKKNVLNSWFLDVLPLLYGNKIGRIYWLNGAGLDNRSNAMSWPKIGIVLNAGADTLDVYDDHKPGLLLHLLWPPSVTFMYVGK